MFAFIMIPTCDVNGAPLNKAARDIVLDSTIIAMSHQFGGCTCTEAVGAWVNDDGAIIREHVTRVESFVGDRVTCVFMADLANVVKVSLQQGAVMTGTVEGRATFN